MTFHPYGLILGLAIVIAWEAGLWFAKKLKVEEKLINEMGWYVVAGGIVGARIYHVVDYWERYYSHNLIKIVYLWEGGLGIWGAVGGGLMVALAYYYINRDRFKFKLLRLMDIVLFGVPLGQAIGRWGNFVNNELYGRPTNLPWGINVPNVDGRVHPLFAYESFLNLLLFGIFLRMVNRKGVRPGLISGVYLIGYGLIRLWLEGMRPETMIWKWMGLGVAQWWAGVAIVVGTWLIVYKKKEPKRL